MLLASARGEHEIGAMGRHVVRGLLLPSRPDGWEFVEKLLLAAQRQEGLRQYILETIDECHPDAFRRMLRLLVEHDLTRFSATIRAIDTWFGFGYEALNARECNQTITHTLRFLADPAARQEAIAGADAQAVYLALWASAFEDAPATIPCAQALLTDALAERRFAGAHLLAQIGLPEAKQALLPALEDADLRVVARAFLGSQGVDERLTDSDLFERLERALPRFPRKEQTLSAIVWPWMTLSVSQSDIADTLGHRLGARSPQRLIPYLPLMTSYARGSVVEMLAKTTEWDTQTRDTLFALVGDTTEWVREKAVQAISRCAITETEAANMERLLTRKAGDLRRSVISLLLNQTDEAALTSAARLLDDKNPLPRQAGLEILAQMSKAERAPDACRDRARSYRQKRPEAAETEANLLDAILDAERAVPTLDNALGLLDPARRTPPTPPRRIEGLALVTEAAAACVKALDELIHSHRETPVDVKSWNGATEEVLLGNMKYSWLFPSPNHAAPLEEDIARLPLREVWETWWNERPPALRDADGFELLRASVNHASVHGKDMRYKDILERIFPWLLRLHPPKNAA